ncbi:MAG: diaminopimelate decarboxylase [Spirochaetales bacterium]|uniref:Diaminopimelate decarboxylase n=1 Tax=Candidatus Thalassospirochaeta sargassi TaxID=3119039 RepID=A0AAJ1IE20_9SPIO|nr:diaminopimelate decarboxylase [Spirochaetales bacterium]
MSSKKIPFSKEQLDKIIEKYPTPFHIYDEKAIRENARELYNHFSWVPGGFKNFFAVKACPNPYIMDILKEEGMGADCSSLPELLLADAVGIKGSDIFFSSNDTPADEYIKAKDLDVIINLDDISHIDYLEKNAGIPDSICFRYNPGPLKEGNVIIGKPEEAKYGFTREQLFNGYKRMKDKGVKHFGLHTMVASNELNWTYFVETADLLLTLVAELSTELDITFDFINLGGGIGIPYKPEDEAVDLGKVSDGIKALYAEKIKAAGLPDLRIVMESGRMVMGPYGYLVTKVLHRKDTYKTFIGLDASMANLMRPALYGAYHHITPVGKENAPLAGPVDVTGSLCENNDKFAIDRNLPELEAGDVLVIHDTGAHGYAMGFNYNGKLRSAELLLKEDGSVVQIRRAETEADYFATLDYPGL